MKGSFRDNLKLDLCPRFSFIDNFCEDGVYSSIHSTYSRKQLHAAHKSHLTLTSQFPLQCHSQTKMCLL